MFRDTERADKAKSDYVAGVIDTVAQPVVRPPAPQATEVDAAFAEVDRDPVARSIPGVALVAAAFTGKVASITSPRPAIKKSAVSTPVPPTDDTVVRPVFNIRVVDHPADVPPVVPATSIPVAPAAPDISREELSIGKRILNWRTLVPLVAIVVIMGLAIKSLVAGFSPALVGRAIAEANPVLLLIGFISFYLSFVVRVVRWRVLLTNVGIAETRLPRLPKLFEILYLSWFANCVVPAKLGDLYRAYLLKQEANISGTRSFGTVLAERLLDFIVLMVLFIGASFVNLGTITANLNPRIRTTLLAGLVAISVLIVAGVAGLIILGVFREQIRARVPARYQERYDDFQAGTLGSFRRLPLLTIMTVLVWGCEAGRFFFVAQSVNLLQGTAVAVFFIAMFVALGESLLTVVPFTSGGIGIVEAGMLAMLLVFASGVNAQNAAAAAIVLDRLISLVSILVFGGLLYLFVFVRAARKSVGQATSNG